MAKKSNGIWYVIGTLGALFLGKMFVDSYNQRLQFRSPRMRVKGYNFSPEGVTLEVTMPIDNTNTTGVTVSDFTGALWYGPHQVAVLDQRAPIKIEGKKVTDYKVEATVVFAQVKEEVKKAIQSKQYLQAFRLKGTMRVGAISVPIDEQLTLLV